MRLEPIGTLRTCFPEKLGIPRQPGLVPLARGILRFSSGQPPAVWRDALAGLDGFSHVWITFVFDRALEQGWKARVRPPRLDGKEKMGVFATRSPHRPNFLGLSLCRLERVDLEEPSVLVSGVDLLDGTPVVDLRPYHPENDVPQGKVDSGWIARAAEPGLPVAWDTGVKDQLEPYLGISQERGMPGYRLDEAQDLVEQVVGMDPRPAHRRGRDGDWYLRLLGFDVRVGVEAGMARIREIRP
jgi:tRNA-Thr(GGU) m(6)t(6)A37 methyltransferase TsaA